MSRVMTRNATTAALAAAFVGAAGCSFGGRLTDAGPGGPDGTPGVADARIDAMPGDPCLDWQFTPAEFDPCAIPQPGNTGPINLGSGDWSLDGGTGVLTDGSSSIQLDHVDRDGASIVSVDHLVVSSGASLRGVGALPLVLVSWHDATIDGLVDVSSHRDNTMSPPTSLGAGANPSSCPDGSNGLDGPEVGSNDGAGDGGSGGGGFNTGGGDGGEGGNGAAGGGKGGDGRDRPARVEGGCAGAQAQSGASGIGGPGGGAVAIIVKGSLTVTGVVHAGGCGGGGALSGGSEAGGGGGSGGMIKLEAANLLITPAARIAANGGQGGGGNHNNSALPGADGQPDLMNLPITNKEGGGGNGGGGGHRGAEQGGSGTRVNDGGGGGGGAAGYVVYRGHVGETVDTGTFSPDGVLL